MANKKKVGKERLDKYYRLAKEQGFRARSAFKLIQLNKKYNFLENSRVLVDLCAAPGGWLQVASKYMPISHLIIGVDLVPIKAIPNVVTFTGDITTEKCRSDLKKELKTWKVDVFLHDGAPNVGSAWSKDAYSQSELVLMALKLATEFLVPNGWLITKVFRSKDYNALLWVFNQLFDKVEATKPPSSRNASAEIFVVCKGFKAPKKIDPKFFDPKAVFDELEIKEKPTNIYHPEKHIRQRGGYEDGITSLFKSISASDFIKSADPVSTLGLYNQISFSSQDDLEYLKFPETNQEIQLTCSDLKVLGRKEFRSLLKWRLKMLDCLNPKKEEIAVDDAVSEKDEEPDLAQQLENLSKENSKKIKKEKRKVLERKAKQRMRLQLGMALTEEDSIVEMQEDGLFSLKNSNIKKSTNLDFEQPESSGNESASSESEEEHELDADLDLQYEEYQNRKMAKDPYLLVKNKRAENSTSFYGFEGRGSDQDDNGCSDDDFKGDSEKGGSDNENSVNRGLDENDGDDMLCNLKTENDKNSEKTMKTALWYSNPIFKELEEEEQDEQVVRSKKQEEFGQKKDKVVKKPKKAIEEEEKEIEFVKAEDEFNEQDKMQLFTPEAMTMATKLRSKKAKQELIDDSFNRYSFNDREFLPSWFKDDEMRHNKLQKPVTKEAMAILKEKLKTINARPIKKVLEAKGRQKMRAFKKIEALKKKAAVIADSEDISESQKAKQIQKMIKNGSKSKKKQVRLVVAKGPNRGNKGRPKGTKGKYKMVDSRLKKDLKADKRKKRRS